MKWNEDCGADANKLHNEFMLNWVKVGKDKVEPILKYYCQTYDDVLLEKTEAQQKTDQNSGGEAKTKINDKYM